MKILLTFLAAFVALAASAQKPFVAKGQHHAMVKNIPAGYGVKYFARDRDGKTYYIVFRLRKAWYEDNASKMFYGTKDSLREIPIKKIANEYSTVIFIVGTAQRTFTINFPTTAGNPWIAEERKANFDDDGDDDQLTHTEHSLTALPCE